MEDKNKFKITVYTPKDYFQLEKILREMGLKEKVGYYEINDPNWKRRST